MVVWKFHGASEQELDAEKRMRTYLSYVRAWASASGRIEELLAAQRELGAFQRLQRKTLSREGRTLLLRGMMTVRALDSLPVAKHNELAFSANLWAPVQAYYAIHGYGLAILSLLNSAKLRRHRSFLLTISDQVFAGLIPFPFNIRCGGDPTLPGGQGLRFYGVELNPTAVVGFSNLANVQGEDRLLAMGKSLETTRSRQIEEKFKEMRELRPPKGKKRRNIKKAEKDRIIARWQATTIADLMFRLRIRSNYEDPSMLLHGQGTPEQAAEYFQGLQDLVQKLSALFEGIIAKIVGEDALRKVRAEVKF